jgi:hypothetical protein
MSQGIAPTFSNIFHFFSTISAFLLIFFMLSISIFNFDLKGLLYLGGILITTILNIGFMNQLGNQRDMQNETAVCNLFNFPIGNPAYNSPSLNSVLISFTATYLILPMIMNNTPNYPVCLFMFSLFGIDGFSKIKNKCTPPSGVLLGGCFGFLAAAGWFAIWNHGGFKSLLYYSETNMGRNNEVCSRPSKQKFKCSVYKNGELISNL